MDINFEIVIGMIVLLATGLGLGLGLKLLKSITNGSGLKGTARIFENRIVRLTAWFILGSLLAKPFMDLSSLLIEFAKVPILLMQSVPERDLPAGWEIVHYVLYLGIRTMLLGLVYGYAVWMVPKLIEGLSFGKGVFIKPRSFEGVCIVLSTGGLMHGLIAPLAFSIQQLSIPALLGYEDSIASYFFGWLVVIMVLPIVAYGISGILRKSLEKPGILSSNLSEQPLEL